MVQFVHRWLAFAVAGRGPRAGPRRLAGGAPAGRRRARPARSTVQILLGILTLLSGVEIVDRRSHQGMAVLLLAAALAAAHRLGDRETVRAVSVDGAVLRVEPA